MKKDLPFQNFLYTHIRLMISAFSLHHSASSERQYTYYNSMVVFGDQKKLPESCRLLVLVAKTKDKRSK